MHVFLHHTQQCKGSLWNGQEAVSKGLHKQELYYGVHEKGAEEAGKPGEDWVCGVATGLGLIAAWL